VVLFGFFKLLYYLSAYDPRLFPEATSPFSSTPRKTGLRFAEIIKNPVIVNYWHYRKKNIFLFTKKQADV